MGYMLYITFQQSMIHYPIPPNGCLQVWGPSNEFLFHTGERFWVGKLVQLSKGKRAHGSTYQAASSSCSWWFTQFGHGWFKSQSGFLLCMVCHRVVAGLSDLELNQEFVEKRIRISSAWNTEWEFESLPLGSAENLLTSGPSSLLWIFLSKPCLFNNWAWTGLVKVSTSHSLIQDSVLTGVTSAGC